MDKSSVSDNHTYDNFYSSLQHLKSLQKEFESQEKYSEAKKIEQQIAKLKEKKKKHRSLKLSSVQKD